VWLEVYSLNFWTFHAHTLSSVAGLEGLEQVLIDGRWISPNVREVWHVLKLQAPFGQGIHGY
jgi:hypothetical protein